MYVRCACVYLKVVYIRSSAPDKILPQYFCVPWREFIHKNEIYTFFSLLHFVFTAYRMFNYKSCELWAIWIAWSDRSRSFYPSFSLSVAYRFASDKKWMRLRVSLQMIALITFIHMKIAHCPSVNFFLVIILIFPGVRE